MPRLGDDAGAAGYSLVALETVDSTNRLALDLAEQARANKTWVVAETQRAGRGRHGRAWQSPPGNLYTSLLLVAPCAPADTPKLGFVAGLAVADALRQLGVADAVLKWPNDILCGGRKLAGILLEGRMLPDGRQTVAIGIGINVANAPPVLTGHSTSLAEAGIGLDRRDVFRRLSNVMSHWHGVFDKGQGFAAIRAAWLERALPIGAGLSVKLPKKTHQGTFAGIDGEGRLLLKDASGQTEIITTGDVFVMEPANAQ